MFLPRFLASNVLCALFVCTILLVKKIFNKKLSVKHHYMIWFTLLLSLGVVFLPDTFFVFDFLPETSIAGLTGNISGQTEAAHMVQGSNWMQDFSETVYQTDYTFLKEILLVVWFVGILAGLCLFILNVRKIIRMRRNSQTVSPDMSVLFEQCRQQICPKAKVVLFESAAVKSPMSLGIWMPVILLPKNLESQFDNKAIRYILLHELIHVKHHDLLFNVLLCFLQIFYWFNPFVWLAFRHLRLDREMYCDHTVMEMSDDSDFLSYGYTLLNFAEVMTASYMQMTSNISGTKKQLKKRIQKIASYSKESKNLRRTSVSIILAVALLAAVQFPVLSAFALDNDWYIPKEQLTIRQEDLNAYFEGHDGSFVLYDQNLDQFLVYNEESSRTRVSPNSTYKIFCGLDALEQSVITPAASARGWDGKQYEFSTWNRDQNLNSAMQNSVNWYFQSIDQQISKTEIQQFLSRIHYGNCDISGKRSNYWMESSLRISPLEQAILLKNLYFNAFGFKEENIETIKNAMFLEQSGETALYGKTGSGNINGSNVNGWFVGYVETADNTYFFTTYVCGENNVSGSTAAELTLAILDDKQIYPKFSL